MQKLLLSVAYTYCTQLNICQDLLIISILLRVLLDIT